MNYVITSKHFSSPLLHSMKEMGVAMYLSEEELKSSSFRFSPSDKIYSAAGESAIPAILARSNSQDTAQVINRLQNKYEFRKLIAPFFPDFEFRALQLHDLCKHVIDHDKTFVVKLVKG